MKIVLATRNAEKLKEMKRIVDGKSVEFVALPANAPTPAEDGKTFEENALKKAKSACKFTKLPALADDSGICVDALGGAPGVKSARFAAGDKARNAKLLRLLHNTPTGKRGVGFVCVAALVFPDGREFVVRGEARGKIAENERGRAGFGYDPIFIPAGYARTYAELGRKIKNRISHRARAFLKMRKVLKKLAA